MLIEREYSKEHDISREIYNVLSVLKEFGFSNQKVGQIVLRNKARSFGATGPFTATRDPGYSVRMRPFVPFGMARRWTWTVIG